MASQGGPAWNGPRLGNLGFRSRRGPADQEGEEVAEVSFSSPGLISLANSGRGHGRAQIRDLWQAFCDWLQPETNSKQEMIVCLVLEQFLHNRPHRDRAAWQRKWESCGRDLESFMEDLDDEDLRPVGLVHVQMRGQEALFSENMPLGQVVAHFMEQHPAVAPTAFTPGTPSRTPPDTSRPTAPGDAGEHGGSLSSEDHPPPSLLILQGESRPGPAEGAASWESPRSPGAASPGASAAQEEPPREETPEETREETQEETRKPGGGSPGSTRKLYSCDKCPRKFRYFSRFQLHQRRHNNERPCVCPTCGKAFFQASDLRVHQRIHARVRPFRCGSCSRAFSHRTNLVAHERIHTGAMPYACAQCGRAYRQSSTYHRHLRMHQRKDSMSGASTPRASTSPESTSGDSPPGDSRPGVSSL